MKQLLFIVCLFSICSCTVHNRNFTSYNGPMTGSNLPPSEPGKCYAKSLMSDKYGLRFDTTLIYTGADMSLPGVKTEVVELAPSTTRWVKKRADKNCLSADPNDCLVWCLQEIPAERDTLVTVTDTMLVKEFRTEILETKFLDEPGGFTAWQEVICDKDLTSRFILDLREALVNQGYQVEMGKDKIDGGLKKVIKEYQVENYLPIGQLDIQTLDMLGVKW